MFYGFFSQSMELIDAPSEDATDDEAGNIITDKQGEDSDGISVITESEAEQLVVNKKFGDIDDCKNQICAVLKTGDKQGEKTAPQVINWGRNHRNLTDVFFT